MFTSIDKAIVAVIMGAIFLLNTYGGIDVGVSEETVNTVVAGLTPILVWLVPNKPS